MQATMKVSDDSLLVPPGLRVPLHVDVEVRGVPAVDPGKPPVVWQDGVADVDRERLAEVLNAPTLTVHLGVDYDEALGRYKVSTLTVDAGDREVNGVILRQLRVLELMRHVGRAVAMPPGSKYDANLIADQAPAELEKARRRGPTERLLWSVAFEHRAAEISGGNSALSVQAAFGLQPRTASHWIRRARERGMFERMAP